MRTRTRTLAVALLMSAGVVLLCSHGARAADPTMSDCIQANEGAIKLRADKRLRQARSQWLVCAADSCGSEISNVCKTRVAEVNAAIPTIVFEAVDGTGNALTAVKVSMDGQPLVDRLEGTAISLDPGEHTFTFQTEGQAPVEKKLVINEGQKDRPEKVVIGTPPPAAAQPSATPAPVTSAAPASSGPATEPAASTPDTGGSGWSTQRWMALGLAGVGLVGVVVGAVEGLSANSSWNNSKNECSPNNCPASSRPQALSDHDSASSAATISTVGFAVGGAALVGGVVWFLLAPAHDASAERAAPAASVDVVPTMGPGGGGMLLRGSF